MSVSLVEWQTPRTWGTAIEVDNVNKIISLLLREENNLLHVNEDNELYCDLQIENWIAPTDDFEVWVTTGIVNASDGRDQNWLLLHYETTSWAYAQWLYGADWKLYFDWWTGTFNQVYYSSEVNTLINDLRTEIAWQYMKYQDFNFDEQTEQGQTSVTLSLNTMFSPTANFVVNAPASVKDWQIYVLRVTNGSTPYTMTLSGMIENPLGVNTSLTANSTDQFVFLAVWNKLELQPCLPDRLSAFINDMGFITNTVNNLTNYYTKTETYTKAEVNNLVSNFGGFEVVATLPATDIKTNVIYLLWPIGSLPDKYEEYIYSNNTWVLIWETSVDLTNYYTKTETDTAISTAISTIQSISMFQITDPTDQWELADLFDWTEWIDISTTLPILVCNGLNYFFVSRVSLVDTFIWWLDTYQRLEIHYTSQDHMTRDGVGYIEIDDVYTAWTWISVSNGGVISNTWVTSVNWNTGAVTVNEAKKSSTAPSNPSQWDLWYDTTNNVLKVYNGSIWVEVVGSWWWVSQFEINDITDPTEIANLFTWRNAIDANQVLPVIWHDWKRWYLVGMNNITDYFANWDDLMEIVYLSDDHYHRDSIYSISIDTVIPNWVVSYSDFGFVTATLSDGAITLDLSTTYTPTANFTVNKPSTIKDWMQYLLRIENWATAYTMTLGTWVTNPYNVDLTLTANETESFVFLAVWWNLELQPVWDVTAWWSVIPIYYWVNPTSITFNEWWTYRIVMQVANNSSSWSWNYIGIYINSTQVVQYDINPAHTGTQTNTVVLQYATTITAWDVLSIPTTTYVTLDNLYIEKITINSSYITVSNS